MALVFASLAELLALAAVVLLGIAITRSSAWTGPLIVVVVAAVLIGALIVRVPKAYRNS